MCGPKGRVSSNEKFRFMRLSVSPYPGTFADENGSVCGNNAQNVFSDRRSTDGKTWSRSKTTWSSENFAGIEKLENPVPLRIVCGSGMAYEPSGYLTLRSATAMGLMFEPSAAMVTPLL